MFDAEVITKEMIEKAIEKTQKFRELYYTNFLKNYRQRVNEFYFKEYQESPDNFQFMQPISIIFLYTNNGVYNLMCSSDKNEDTFSFISTWLTEAQIKKINTIPDDLRDEEIFKLTSNTINLDSLIEIRTSYLDAILCQPENVKYAESKAIDNGINAADKNHNTYKLNKLFNDCFTSYKDLSDFGALNLNLIFSKVNDEEFKYELEESAKAYKAELYLASATTAEISIETLLRIIIIKKLGQNKLPKMSYILTSANLLLNEKIIDKKLFHRIEAINNLRHGLAHSTTGQADKWDCEQIFGLIKILIDTFF